MKTSILTLRTGQTGGAIVATALLMAGCCTSVTNNNNGGACFVPCKDNLKNGLPIITCQPIDAKAKVGESATFYAEATGEHLSYDWQFWDFASNDYISKPGWDKPTLTISPVAATDYGLYQCVIRSHTSGNGFAATQTREAVLGPKPGGSGGPFTPMQWSASGTGPGGNICGVTVSKKWVDFPSSQAPSANSTFVGSVWNVSVSPPVKFTPTTDYVLQWYTDDINNIGCCTPTTPASNKEVSCPVTANVQYYFTAHFKAGKISNGVQVELRGVW